MSLLLGLTKLFASPLTGALLDAQKQYLAAKNDSERLELEGRIAKLNALRDTNRIAAENKLSPVAIGQYLIVVPFGLHWAAVYLDSIFGFPFDILREPEHVYQAAMVLIPAIVTGQVVERAIGKLKR